MHEPLLDAGVPFAVAVLPFSCAPSSGSIAVRPASMALTACRVSLAMLAEVIVYV